MISLMISFTPSLENRVPALPVPATELEKKCLRLKIPHSVCMYFEEVMRDTVASCTPISPATSFSVRGLMYFGPLEEELALELHDGAADLQQRLVALADGADEPPRVLEVLRDELPRLGVLGARRLRRAISSNSGLMPSTGIISSFRMITNSPSCSTTCTSGRT